MARKHYAMTRHESVKLNMYKIEMALQRIKSKTYGVCATCGEPIEPERLQIVPTAVNCSVCAE
jgi:RNA polymerase-binding transcription factor DksA